MNTILIIIFIALNFLNIPIQAQVNNTCVITANVIVFKDYNLDKEQGVGEDGWNNIGITLYEDTNGDGLFNGNDMKIETHYTNSAGITQFSLFPETWYFIESPVKPYLFYSTNHFQVLQSPHCEATGTLINYFGFIETNLKQQTWMPHIQIGG